MKKVKYPNVLVIKPDYFKHNESFKYDFGLFCHGRHVATYDRLNDCYLAIDGIVNFCKLSCIAFYIRVDLKVEHGGLPF